MESILIDGSGGANWIGGLYYKRNVCYSLLKNQRIIQKYRLLVMTELENKNLFIEAGVPQECIISSVSGNLLKRMYYLWKMIHKYNIQYIYPQISTRDAKIYSIFGIKNIMWIADFQDSVLPELFNDKELKFCEFIL